MPKPSSPQAQLFSAGNDKMSDFVPPNEFDANEPHVDDERRTSANQREIPAHALRRVDGELKSVRHPVEMAAIEPKTRKLTLLARRHWMFLVSYALASPGNVTPSGITWRIPMSTFRRDIKYDSNDTELLKEGLRQCQRTLVEWADSAADSSTGKKTEWASTQLLGSCEFVVDGSGRRYIDFSFPPTLLRQMLEHKVYFESSLEVANQLTRHASLALFQIVSRYRTSPGGVTKARPWREWIPVLTGESQESSDIRSLKRGDIPEPGGSKYREWRYFNRDVIAPAVSELNQVLDDIWVEAVPIRRGRVIAELRFKITARDGFKLGKKKTTAVPPGHTLAIEAMVELGLTKTLALQLCKEHTAELMLKAAEKTKQRRDDKRKPPVENVQGLLITIMNALIEDQKKVAAQPQPKLRMPSPDKAADDSLDEYRNTLSAQARRDWLGMPQEVRDDYLLTFATTEIPTAPQLVQTAHKKSGIEPPIVRARFFMWLAKTIAGDDWTPGDRQLLAFERSRRNSPT